MKQTSQTQKRNPGDTTFIDYSKNKTTRSTTSEILKPKVEHSGHITVISYSKSKTKLHVTPLAKLSKKRKIKIHITLFTRTQTKKNYK